MEGIRKSVIRAKLTLLCVLLGYQFNAQGCSDAGFCTIGNLNQQREDSTRQGQKITLLLPIGQGDEGVFIFTPGIQYDNQLSPGWGIQAKITANHATGDLGSASGFGDAFLSGTYTFHTEKKWKTSLTLGTKLPLNLGNIKMGGKSLPMQYQSSLGTIDIITGFSITNTLWQFSAGWQQPVSGINRNNFLPVYWNTGEANNFPPTNDFNRKGDVLLRATYMFTIKKNLSINPGLLGIYHLAKDTYIDANVGNEPIPIKGSKGLTLNATVVAMWRINDSINLGFSAGTPLVFRQVRPDGLTRKFVFAPEVSFKF